MKHLGSCQNSWLKPCEISNMWQALPVCATHHSSYFVNFSHLVRENILTKSDFFWATFTTHLVYVTLLVSQYIHIRSQILELTIKKKKPTSAWLSKKLNTQCVSLLIKSYLFNALITSKKWEHIGQQHGFTRKSQSTHHTCTGGANRNALTICLSFYCPHPRHLCNNPLGLKKIVNNTHSCKNSCMH